MDIRVKVIWQNNSRTAIAHLDKNYRGIFHWLQVYHEDWRPARVEPQNNYVHFWDSAQKINFCKIFQKGIQDQGNDSFSGTSDTGFNIPIIWPDMGPIPEWRILV